MSLLSRHLEQISLSAESISTLPFPPPKIFTNALLSTTDITLLIRDTEPHERALFSVPPPPSHNPSASAPSSSTAPRRQTVFNVAGGEVTASHTGSRAPRRNTAVAAVLGSELHSEVRKTEGGKGEIDIEVLLRGVEKLNAVYEVPGAKDKVERLRARYAQVVQGLRHYEEKVERQMTELERGRRGDVYGDEGDEDEEWNDEGLHGREEVVEVTEEDLRAEEGGVRELERRKRELEERVSGMERDLGGLLR